MTLTIDIDDATRQRLSAEAALVGKTIEDYAAAVLGKPQSSSTNDTAPRRLGWASGRGIWMSDDLDEPLEEFKDYM